ncbi:MAG: LysR family transcriptional regulator [Isosphaeraceae bacterium]|nr:LysR family transcriptional regulator [Isosphaeraceae bacterium]
MRDDLSGLKVLLCVARKKSFTAAAAELRVTPSAVSQTVRVLEDRVGVRLLARTTRNVGLTEAGARFVAQLQPALDQIDEAFESLGALQGRPSGLLRLTMLRTGYADVVRPILSRFLAEHPDVRIDISLDEGLSNVVTEGFDAGVRLGHALDQEMIAVRISPDQRIVVVGSPAYLSAHPRPEHPRDLHDHDCINLRKFTKGTVDRWRFVEHGRDLEVAVDGPIVTNDGSVLVDAAADGLGLAYVFENMVTHLVSEKRLVRVLDPYCPMIPGYFLYYPSRAHVPLKLRAFVDFLKSGTRRTGPKTGSGRSRTKRRS